MPTTSPTLVPLVEVIRRAREAGLSLSASTFWREWRKDAPLMRRLGLTVDRSTSALLFGSEQVDAEIARRRREADEAPPPVLVDGLTERARRLFRQCPVCVKLRHIRQRVCPHCGAE